jgi:hypothetical protein
MPRQLVLHVCIKAAAETKGGTDRNGVDGVFAGATCVNAAQNFVELAALFVQRPRRPIRRCTPSVLPRTTSISEKTLIVVTPVDGQSSHRATTWRTSVPLAIGTALQGLFAPTWKCYWQRKTYA